MKTLRERELAAKAEYLNDLREHYSVEIGNLISLGFRDTTDKYSDSLYFSKNEKNQEIGVDLPYSGVFTLESRGKVDPWFEHTAHTRYWDKMLGEINKICSE